MKYFWYSHHTIQPEMSGYGIVFCVEMINEYDQKRFLNICFGHRLYEWGVRIRIKAAGEK